MPHLFFIVSFPKTLSTSLHVLTNTCVVNSPALINLPLIQDTFCDSMFAYVIICRLNKFNLQFVEIHAFLQFNLCFVNDKNASRTASIRGTVVLILNNKSILDYFLLISQNWNKILEHIKNI